MTTVIRLKPEELTDDFFKKLKGWVKQNNYLEIKISSVQEGANNLSDEDILKRKDEITSGHGMSFTMEEFEAYIRNSSAK
jgi:hypothetical protein